MEKIWLYEIHFHYGGLYVGQTYRPHRRWKCLKTFRVPHKIKKIRFFFSRRKSDEAEIALIRKYREEGVLLYNRSEGPGGFGCKRTLSATRKIVRGIKKAHRKRYKLMV